MASKYIDRVALDDDTTIPNDTVVDGVTTGHDTHHPNAHGAIRQLEAMWGIAGGSPTTSPPGGGTVPLSTTAGQCDWAAPPVGTPATAITANASYSRASSVGVDPKYAPGDHDHGMPGEITEVFFSFDTVTSPLTGTYKYRVKAPSTLLSIRTVVGTVASTGAAATMDLLKNGVSVLSTKPNITVGQAINTNAPVFTSTALATDDLLSVNLSTGTDGFQLLVIVVLQANSPVGATPVGIDASWGPTDQGFLGWTLDPAGEIGGATILTTGVIYIGAISVRRAMTITNVWCAVSVVGAGLTASQSFMGLYSSGGTLLSATATMTGDFIATGVISKALTTPQSVGPGIYYVAVVSNGTTPPTLARGVTNVTALAALHNAANRTAATARFATNGTGTTLPSSLTMSSNVTTGQVNYWFAIS